MSAWVERRLRRILAEVSRRQPATVAALPEGPPLFGGLGLDSLAGAHLITAVLAEFGVDIALDDLNLDSLETIATLRDFVVVRTSQNVDLNT